MERYDANNLKTFGSCNYSHELNVKTNTDFSVKWLKSVKHGSYLKCPYTGCIKYSDYIHFFLYILFIFQGILHSKIFQAYADDNFRLKFQRKDALVTSNLYIG